MVKGPVKGIVQPAITLPDVQAFMSFAAGTASADQQKRVGDWLLTEACRVMSPTTQEVKAAGSTDLAHDVAFAEGRRYVGVLMREMLLPSTLEQARALTAALHPAAHSTNPPGKPSLPARRRSRRGDPT